MGEATLLSRTGGAPSLAVGMAGILGGVFTGRGLALWYHFAIMFEAVFILTTIDAGTRVGRFMLQELLGHVSAPLGRTSWYPSILFSSFLVVARVGLLPVSGRGRSARRHQLAVAALRNREPAARRGRALRGHHGAGEDGEDALRVGHRSCRSTWLAAATLTAGWQKVFSPDPRLGFLSHAQIAGRSRRIRRRRG